MSGADLVVGGVVSEVDRSRMVEEIPEPVNFDVVPVFGSVGLNVRLCVPGGFFFWSVIMFTAFPGDIVISGLICIFDVSRGGFEGSKVCGFGVWCWLSGMCWWRPFLIVLHLGVCYKCQVLGLLGVSRLVSF